MALHKDTERSVTQLDNHDPIVVQVQREYFMITSFFRLETWLDPPVQPHLTTYGFHVTNPEAVIQESKRHSEEVSI